MQINRIFDYIHLFNYINMYMIANMRKYFIKPVGLFLLVFFPALLLWCGDPDCLAGKADDTCASLVCSALGTHEGSSQNSTGMDSSACSCVCHIPVISSPSALTLFSSQSEDNLLRSTFFIPFAPTRTIYHPPKSV